MADRLTETRTVNGVKQFRLIGDEGWLTFDDEAVRTSRLMTAVAELAKYEDIDADGRLIRLPDIHVGDKLWSFVEWPAKAVYDMTVTAVKAFYSNGSYNVEISTDKIKCFPPRDIGKTVFLTRNEADAVLKKREERRRASQ